MPDISQRARALLDAEIVDDYLVAERERRRSPDQVPPGHPDEFISLAVAENKLVFDLLEPKLTAARSVTGANTGYDDFTGSAGFRSALAQMMGDTFIGRPVDPDHLVTTSGAGTALETLFYTIADAHEGVLVPTPSYAGFWFDLEGRDRLNIVPVHTHWDDGFRLTPDLLDSALDNADRPVKALLFTTPDNPLGKVYSAEEVAEIVEWARARRLHLVVDEIYALSVFGDKPFVSAAAHGMGDDVHIVWAFSKDFAVSGFRAGVLYTENQVVRNLADTVSYWQSISTDTQFVLGEMISDQEWVNGFVQENQRRLREAHDGAVAALGEIGVKTHPSDAGFFLVADFRGYLSEPTWEAERELWRRIFDDANVNITPGSSLRAHEPGLFRVCFAAQPLENARRGIERIGAVLAGR